MTNFLFYLSLFFYQPTPIQIPECNAIYSEQVLYNEDVDCFDI